MPSEMTARAGPLSGVPSERNYQAFYGALSASRAGETSSLNMPGEIRKLTAKNCSRRSTSCSRCCRALRQDNPKHSSGSCAHCSSRSTQYRPSLTQACLPSRRQSSRSSPCWSNSASQTSSLRWTGSRFQKPTFRPYRNRTMRLLRVANGRISPWCRYPSSRNCLFPLPPLHSLRQSLWFEAKPSLRRWHLSNRGRNQLRRTRIIRQTQPPRASTSRGQSARIPVGSISRSASIHQGLKRRRAPRVV